MSKIFLDASVLLEIMFSRSKMGQVSALLHDARHEFFTSALSVHTLYYFAEVEGIDRDFVRRLSDLGLPLPIDGAVVKKAQSRYQGRDFEDCLQAVCAETGGCDEIVSLDKNFKRLSGTVLPVRTI